MIVAVAAWGCVPALTGDDLCDEATQAVALRTLQCTSDAALANARHDAVAEGTCVADPARADVLVACPAAMLAAACAEVEAHGDQPSFWLALDPACAEVLSAAPASGTSGDTGAPVDDTGPGSCAAPILVDLTTVAPGAPLVVAVPDAGDSTALDACRTGGPSVRDLVFEVVVGAASTVAVTVSGATGEVPTLVLAAGDLCPPVGATSCSGLLPGTQTNLFVAPGPQTRRVVFQPTSALPGASASFVALPGT